MTGDDSQTVREKAVQQLENGELDYLLTVDIFNEGIDIPSVNQVVMLRNTQSSIIFIQQLGRGLRKHDSKEYVTIIGFHWKLSKQLSNSCCTIWRSVYEQRQLSS